MGLTCLVGSCVIETRGLRMGSCRWGLWGGGWRGGEGGGDMLREVAGMAATSAKGLASEELWCEPLPTWPLGFLSWGLAQTHADSKNLWRCLSSRPQGDSESFFPFLQRPPQETPHSSALCPPCFPSDSATATSKQPCVAGSLPALASTSSITVSFQLNMGSGGEPGCLFLNALSLILAICEPYLILGDH